MKKTDKKVTGVLWSSVKFALRLCRLVSLNTKINVFRSINTQGVRGLYNLFLISLFVLMVACQATPHWAPYDRTKQDVYPTKYWQKAQTPEQLGWSSEKLAVAREYSKQLDTAGVMIVDNGVVVDAWGDIAKNFQCHSMRKSLMSAIIGVHVDQGNLDLSKTIEELGIDDYPPALTASKAERVKVEIIREVAVDNDKKANKILNNFAIEFQHSERDVTIKAEFKIRKFFFWDDGRSRLKVHYLISVPEKYNLALKTSGGSISVDNLEGEVHSKTSGGSLHFGNIKGPVQGKTSGGSISLDRCIGTADIRTSGGNIEIGEVDGSVKAETSGGSIQIQSAKGSVNAKTSGGNIRVKELMGPIIANTSGGSVSAYISSQPESNCDLRTSGGKIEIYLVDDIAINVDAKTSGGKVVTDFPVTVQGELKKSVLVGKINGGGPELLLRTSGGNIKLYKR